MQKKVRSSLKFRPNPARQAILIGLALVGIGIGYGMGFLLKKDSPQKPAAISGPAATEESTPSPASQPKAMTPPDRAMTRPSPQAGTILPETDVGNGPTRAYEEALPHEIVHFPALSAPPGGAPAATAEPSADSPPESPAPASEANNAKPPETPQEVLAVADPARQATLPAEPEPGADTSSLAASRLAPAPRSLQAEGWLTNALMVPLTDKPKIAIVIDDMGVDQRRSQLTTELTGPLTLSFLTYAQDLPRQTRAAREAGHELMLHVPMEPSSRDIDPGPNVLLSGVPAPEIQAALEWGLDQFSGYVGVNNHMGSRFTSDLEGMKVLMRELRQRKMIFLDSVTSGSTKGQIAAHQYGVPFIARNIFLDHIDDIDEVRARLQDVKRLASRQGYAVAIGHPRDATLKALAPWLKTINKEGFQLVPISALIRQASEDTSIASTSTPTEVPPK